MSLALPQLPVAFMNEDHAHAAEQLAAMQAALAGYAADPQPMVRACREFLDHNRAHFAREEVAMQASGFPPYAIHKAEHERTLAWLAELAVGIEAGLAAETVSRAVAQEIPAWFIQHIQTMDWATANWIASH